MPSGRKITRLETWLALVFVLAAGALFVSFVKLAILDDAFISFRYSWNLAHGRGLVFNPGERVEGFSDPLWVFLCAGAIAAGMRVEAFSCIAGIACGAVAFWLVWRAGREKLGLSTGAAICTLALGFFNGCFWWVMGSGMEGGLYALLISLALFFLLAGRPRWSGLWLGLCAWVHPEAAAFILLLILVLALGKVRPAEIARVALPGFLLVAGLFLLRIAYYHELLPNTVIAKSMPLWGPGHVGRVTLREQATLGLQYVFWFAVPEIVLVGGLIASLRASKLPYVALAGWIVAYECFVAIANGGDWVIQPRLLLPLVPAMAMAALPAIRRTWQWEGMGRSAAAIGAIAGAGISLLILPVSSMYGRPDLGSVYQMPAYRLRFTTTSRDDPYGIFAARVGPLLKPGDVVAPERLGLFSYMVPNAYSHDYMGLTDRYVARHGVWVRYMGRNDYRYTAETVRPAVYVWHSGLVHPQNTLRVWPEFVQKYRIYRDEQTGLTIAIRMDRLRLASELGGLRPVALPPVG